MEALASVIAMDVLSCAITSKHMHPILRNRLDVCAQPNSSSFKNLLRPPMARQKTESDILNVPGDIGFVTSPLQESCN